MKSNTLKRKNGPKLQHSSYGDHQKKQSQSITYSVKETNVQFAQESNSIKNVYQGNTGSNHCKKGGSSIRYIPKQPSLVQENRKLDQMCSREKELRQRAEKNIVLQSHIAANKIKQGESQKIFWMNKCLELNLKLKTYELEQRKKTQQQNQNSSEQQAKKLKLQLQTKNQTQKQEAEEQQYEVRIERLFKQNQALNSSIRQNEEKLEEREKIIEGLINANNQLNSEKMEQQIQVDHLQQRLTEAYDYQNPANILEKIYRFDNQTILWIMWNLTTHFAQVNGVPTVPHLPTKSQTINQPDETDSNKNENTTRQFYPTSFASPHPLVPQHSQFIDQGMIASIHHTQNQMRSYPPPPHNLMPPMMMHPAPPGYPPFYGMMYGYNSSQVSQEKQDKVDSDISEIASQPPQSQSDRENQ